MGDNTSLGDRMKAHERVTKTRLPRRTYTLLRLDGRAFHTYCRGLVKPYDQTLVDDMNAVTEALVDDITGSVFAYTQSDEISILITDFQGVNTQPWFDGNVQKMVSVSSSLAAAIMNIRRYETTKRIAQFDARIFTLSDPMEVANYFLWRQRDAVRNSISMAAQAQFSHRELQGVNSNAMQEMLFTQKGINWNDYPAHMRRGRVTVKEAREEEVSFFHKGEQAQKTVMVNRSVWVTKAAPHLTTEPGGFLAENVPQLPRLG